MRILGLALAAIFATGCVQGVGQPDFLGWDGAVYRYVECDRTITGMPTCLDNARRLCPAGYQVAEERYNTDGEARGSLIVRCGPQPAAAPVVTTTARPAPPQVMAPK